MKTGAEWYKEIVAAHPDLLSDHFSKTIWIDGRTGIFVLGEGLDGLDALQAKISEIEGDITDSSRARDFYSRCIGKLGRIASMQTTS